MRGRLGWASGSLLAYGSAGVAISNSKINVTGYCPPDQYSTSGSRTLVGYSIGAGADYAVTETAIVRLEYIYDGYGHQSEDVGSGAPNYWQNRQLNLTTQTFRAALINLLTNRKIRLGKRTKPNHSALFDLYVLIFTALMPRYSLFYNDL